MRVLVVEDDSEWRKALSVWYKSTLARWKPTVIPISSGLEAIELMENEVRANRKFNLLSLDIDLGSTHLDETGSLDRTRPGGTGRDVLSHAHRLRACHGVIVITGIPSDHGLWFSETNETGRVREYNALSTQVKKWFPNRSHVHQKVRHALPRAVQETVRQLEESFPPEELYDLAAPNNKFVKKDGDWRIEFDGGEPVLVKDRVGLRELAEILLRPNEKIAVKELITRYPIKYREGEREHEDQHLAPNSYEVGSSVDSITDEEAEKKFKGRLAQLNENRKSLRAEKEEADFSRGSQIEHELYEIDKEIACYQKTYPHLFMRKGGRRWATGQFPTPEKRERDAFRQRIDRVIDWLSEKNRGLGEHLRSTIDRRGRDISYNSEIEWDVRY